MTATAEHEAPARSRRVARQERPFWLVALLVIGAVAGAAYWPLLLGRIPLPIDIIFSSPVFDGVREQYATNGNHAELGDLVAGFYPIHQYVSEALKAGSVPLWNPHLLLGTPLLAAYQPGVLYPPNLLFYGLLPMSAAWSLLFPLRLLIAGLGMALFVRALGGTRIAGIVSGLAFAFSGFLITWSGWPHVDVAVWLPWLFLALHALRARPGPRRAGLLAIAVALPLLAGHPQTMTYVAMLTVLWALWLTVLSQDHGKPDPGSRFPMILGEGWGRYLGWAVAAGALGLGLAAMQLLPTAEWLGLLLRDTGDKLSSHLPGGDWIAFLSRDTRRTPNGAGLKIPEGAAYLGVVPLFGIALAALSRRRWDVAFFGATFAVAFLVAFGWKPFYDVFENAPVFSGLPNQRILVLAMFAGAVLAGLGITAWQERLREPQPGVPAVLTWWGAIGAVTLIAIWGVGKLGDRVGPTLVNGELYESAWFRGPTSTLALVLLAAILLSPLLRRVPGALVGVALVGVLAVDVLSYSFGHLPFVDNDAAYPEPPVFAQLEDKDPGVYRVMALDNVYAKNLELQYFEDSPGGTGYQLEAVDPLLRDFGAAFSGYVFHSDKVVANLNDRLDLYNVKYVYTTPYNESYERIAALPQRFREVLRTPTVVVFENLEALPRAFVAPTAKEVPAEQAYCALDDPSFRADQVALISPADDEAVVPAKCPAGDSRLGAAGTSAGAVVPEDIDVNVNTVDVRLDGTAAGVLVLSDVYYPGWTVTVDGDERELLRVDGALKGVRVAAGDERVQFAYEAPSFRRGLLVTGVSALAVLVLLAWPWLTRRPYARRD